MDFKKLIAEQVSIEGMTTDEVLGALIPPKDARLGEYCIPTFKLAKEMKKSPIAIAEQVAKAIVKPVFLESVTALAGYINFKLSKEWFARSVIEEAREKGRHFGQSDVGLGKTICVDYSSINIAKPFHIGHLSTTVIGAAICRINTFLGYKSVGINHLGDWGTQFGKLIVAFKKWGDKETIEKGGVREMLKIYVRFHEQAKIDPSLDDEARKYFLDIERGEISATTLFTWFKELTLKEVSKIYERLNITFDSYAGESFYNDKMEPVLEELQQKGLLVESNNAEVVMLEGMPPCLLKKADGATLYATRDIAAAFYRKKTYDFEKSLYVVAYQQNLHFKQWFEVIRLMGYDWAKDLEHVAFGMVSLEGQALSTRSGNVVFLDEVLEKSVEKALQIISEKNPSLQNKEKIAEIIGIGAVVWSPLINNRIKDIVFSYDKVLNFDGETAPYVQYTCVRANSILSKIACGDSFDYSALTDEFSLDVIRHLSKWQDSLLESAKRSEPSIITRFLVDLSQYFNKFYIENRIADASDGAKNARLALVKVVSDTLTTGLGLLGIQVPEAM